MVDAPLTPAAPDWRRWLLGFAALKLLLVLLVPVLPEEAYHWDFARHPAWSYHNHPPMIAWVIAAGTWIFGDSAFGIRVVPLLLSIGMTWALGRLAEGIHGGRAAVWTVILVSTQPVTTGITAMGFPEAPLLFFWSFALLWMWRALDSGDGRWWIAAGAALGGALLSKYTAFFFGLSALIYLLVSKRDRRWLATPWPYAAGALALLLFGPVIGWNAANDWVSFRFQTVDRFEAMKPFTPTLGLRTLIQQWLAVFPLTLPLAVAAFARIARPARDGDRYLLWLCVPLTGFFLAIAWFRSVHIMWVLPGYLSLTVAMGAAAADAGGRVAAFYAARRRWLLGLTGAACIGVVLHAAFFLPWLSPLRGFYGWREAALRAKELAAGSDPARTIYIGIGRRYACASMMAFHLQEPHRVHSQNLIGKDGDQFNHWDDPQELAGGDAIVILESTDRDEGVKIHLDAAYQTVEALGTLEIPVGRSPLLPFPPVRFAFFRARAYQPDRVIYEPGWRR